MKDQFIYSTQPVSHITNSDYNAFDFTKDNAVNVMWYIAKSIVDNGFKLSDCCLVFHPVFEMSVFTKEQIYLRCIAGLNFKCDFKLARYADDSFDAKIVVDGIEKNIFMVRCNCTNI